jgi:hypothetical protein
MTRSQWKQIEAAREGPRTRSKAAVLERASQWQQNQQQNGQQWQQAEQLKTVTWGAQEKNAAKVLVSLKNTKVSVEPVQQSQRPRRSCANY